MHHKSITLHLMKNPFRGLLILSATGGLLGLAPARAGLVFTIENPGVQATTVAGASTETFDAVPLGVIGTYVSPTIGGTYSGGQVIPHNQYGGAGGTGQYDVVGLGTTVSQTLQFAAPKTYFGLWWSAGDASNKLDFYDPSNALLGSYVIGDIIPFLSSAYLGNPVTGENKGEYYAYLDFTTTAGSQIDRVVFGNVTASGFESDNHSVFDKPITPPGNPIPDSGSTFSLLAGAAVLLGLARRLNRQQ